MSSKVCPFDFAQKSAISVYPCKYARHMLFDGFFCLLTLDEPKACACLRYYPFVGHLNTLSNNPY